MQYNEKYDRYVTKGGLVYRYSKSQDKLILCKLSKTRSGYYVMTVTIPEKTIIYVHRLVYETFVEEIREGYQLDHINTIRTDNRIENLRLATPKENSNNHLTKKHMSEAHRGKTLSEEHKNKISEEHKGKPRSEFGRKFKEHFGIAQYKDNKLYHRELQWYLHHNNTCRWEKEA